MVGHLLPVHDCARGVTRNNKECIPWGLAPTGRLTLPVRVASRYPYVHPFLKRRTAADRALIHQGRAIGASALVAAWDRGVRLGVDKANDARRLTTDGGLGNRSPAGVKLRGGERHHGQRRRPF